jgi:hypothetical protein
MLGGCADRIVIAQPEVLAPERRYLRRDLSPRDLGAQGTDDEQDYEAKNRVHAAGENLFDASPGGYS